MKGKDQVYIKDRYNTITENKYRLHDKVREGNDLSIENIQGRKPSFEEFYTREDTENYVVEYSGDIVSAFKILDFAAVKTSQNYMAIVSVKQGRIWEVLERIPEIINIEKPYVFTLSELQTSDAFDGEKLFENRPESLDGDGVIVAVIGTGIDYTSQRFISDNGNTRIVEIWDQTIESGPVPEYLKYGTVFSQEKINNAIKAKELGRNPYELVGHKDEEGYGTSIAGVIGGGITKQDIHFTSLAPKCSFAAVKLKEAKQSTLRINGISEKNEKVYEDLDIAAALEYLSSLQLRLSKPMVVYIPLGTNCGGHDGGTFIEKYIDIYNTRRGFVIITNSGSEGNTETHTSGMLTQKGDMRSIDIMVDEAEKDFCLSLWITRPDRVEIGIVSPSGEKVERISIPRDGEGRLSFSLADGNVNVEYYIQNKIGAEQILMIFIKNAKGGVWQLHLYGSIVVNGKYDAWLHQRQLLKPGTRFLTPDPNITLTVPSTAVNIITAGCYSEAKNEVCINSGWGFTRDGRINPGRVVRSDNVLTVGLNNTMRKVSGVAVSGAIVTGTVALLLEWGIVEKNDINMYTGKIITYLIRGSVQVEGIEYPNPQWGYGILKCEEVFKNLGRCCCCKHKNKGCFNPFESISMENLYINIPQEIYRRLIKEEVCLLK